jgi:hypothetical protein
VPGIPAPIAARLSVMLRISYIHSVAREDFPILKSTLNTVYLLEPTRRAVKSERSHAILDDATGLKQNSVRDLICSLR